MRLILALVLVGSLFGADNKRESGNIPQGDVLPQVVAGGAWSTDIQLMHAHDEDFSQPFTIRFFGSTGLPLMMPVVGQGMTSVVMGFLQPRGSTLIQLAGGSATIAGYAILDTIEFRGVTMTAVLTQKVAGRPDFQASIPGLSQLGKNFQFPFRNDGPYTTTLAFVANALFFVAVDRQSVLAIARDEQGIEMCRNTWTALDGSHEAFLLSDRLPCSAGRRGVAEVIPSFAGTMIVFLFNDAGAFTTQLPYEICCRGF